MKCRSKAIVFVAALSILSAVSVAASSSGQVLAVPSIPQNNKHHQKRRYSRRAYYYGRAGSDTQYDSVALASTAYRSSLEYQAVRSNSLPRRIPIDDGTRRDSARPYQMPLHRNAADINGRLQALNWITYGIQVMFPALTKWGMKVSEKILAGKDLYRVLTPVFLHGNVMHLATNSQSLGAIGPSLERLMGPGRYLSVYLVSGIAGNIASAFMSPNPSLGASGAVFGVTGSFFALLAMNDQYFGSYGSTVMSRLVGSMAANVFFGFMSPQIDNWAHIGGAAAGIAFTIAFGPRLQLRQRPDGEVFLAEVPLLRLPRYLESIPEKIYGQMTRKKRQMPVNRGVNTLQSRPWLREHSPTPY